MFKIGDFSMLSKVPVKTLRYYDQIDLLKPKQIDQESGYRYYSAEQLLEVNRIFLYKELGFTLKQMGQLLREDISVEQIQGMFLLKESEIQQLIEREQQKLARIRSGCTSSNERGVLKKRRRSSSNRLKANVSCLFNLMELLTKSQHSFKRFIICYINIRKT